MRATPLQRVARRRLRLGRGAAAVLPDRLDGADQLQDRARRDLAASCCFTPTLGLLREVLARADYLSFALNSVVVSVGGTVLALLFAIPAAYAMAFHPTERTRGTLLWMLSTKMLPPVGVLVPIYLLFRTAGPARHAAAGWW